MNTYDLPSRPLYNLTALTLHESAPGHSLQGGLAEEQDRLPEFRRNVYISAYGEGWALYCERLGVEMGMYDTPYDRFGMLTFQMWRAARLVVDTGVHHKGWTREQAIKYLHDNTALADHDIEIEVDRYISWPGQALSYYLGMMAIVEARGGTKAGKGAGAEVRHPGVPRHGAVHGQRADPGPEGPYRPLHHRGRPRPHAGALPEARRTRSRPQSGRLKTRRRKNLFVAVA